MLLTPIAFIYALVCYYWYSRGQTIALTIGSKGGSSTPIAVSGVTGFNNTAAVRALTAEPAEDADAVIKELGALITDIQALGDLGIQKWVQAQASQSGAATVRF